MSTIGPGDVVVAIDGSGHADRALDWAADQAHLDRRRLVVVTVGESAGEIAGAGAATARRLFPGLPTLALSLAGDPRDVLLGLSDQAPLLVVGSRGRGAVRSLLLGSVSAALSAHAVCPVVVCRPAHSGAAARGVVVGADGTPGSRPVVEFAFRQAALHGRPLTVLHCFWDAMAAVAAYREARGEPSEAPELEDLRATLAESVAGFATDYPDVPVTLSLRHGLVDEALSRHDEPWDLVVVGRHAQTSLDRVLTGSIATSVVERSRTTVAVVPEAVLEDKGPAARAVRP